MSSHTQSFNSNRRRNGSQRTSPSQQPPEVIDLTDSPPAPPALRLPPMRLQPRPIPTTRQSFPDREVIDLDSLPEPPQQQRAPSRRPSHYLPSEDVTRSNDVVILGDSPSPVTQPGALPT